MTCRGDWEKQYICAIVDELNPSGKVLLVGAENGFAITRLLAYPIESLTVIEKDSGVIEKIQNQIKDDRLVFFLGRSEELLDNLPTFDVIFYNDFDCDLLKESLGGKDQALMVLNKGKELIALADQLLPEMNQVKYETEDLKEFCQNMEKGQRAHLPRFLAELSFRGQITKEQHDLLSNLFDLPKALMFHEKESSLDKTIHQFFTAVVKSHVNPYARMSLFCVTPTSKYEDPFFFDNFITSTKYDYQEFFIDLISSGDAPYYQFKKALVIKITVYP